MKTNESSVINHSLIHLENRSKVKDAGEDNPGAAMLNIINSAREVQSKFLKSKGMSMEQARAMSKSQQESLQKEYTEWLKTQDSSPTVFKDGMERFGVKDGFMMEVECAKCGKIFKYDNTKYGAPANIQCPKCGGDVYATHLKNL